jgi:hypothetical protein
VRQGALSFKASGTSSSLLSRTVLYLPRIGLWGDVATDRKTALFIVAVILALSLAATAVHEKPLVKNDISLKKKCPSPKPSVTISPYKIPLPIMVTNEKGVGEKG